VTPVFKRAIDERSLHASEERKDDFKAFEFPSPLLPVLLEIQNLELLSAIINHSEFFANEDTLRSLFMVALSSFQESVELITRSHSVRFSFTCLSYQRQSRLVRRMLNTVTYPLIGQSEPTAEQVYLARQVIEQLCTQAPYSKHAL